MTKKIAKKACQLDEAVKRHAEQTENKQSFIMKKNTFSDNGRMWSSKNQINKKLNIYNNILQDQILKPVVKR